MIKPFTSFLFNIFISEKESCKLGLMIFLSKIAFSYTHLDLGFYSVEIPCCLLIISAALFAFAVTYVVIPSIIHFARVKNLFDTPNQRTSHSTAVPNLGGAAVFIGMILPVTLFGSVSFDHEFKYIIIGLMILFFIGIKDDILVISARTKLIAELFAILLIVVLGDIRVSGFHGFMGIHEVPYFVSLLFTVFMFVVIINGFNLIDGIDGLASGVGILSISVLGIWFILSDNITYAAFSFTTVAALIAFFRFNVFSGKNKIFLGDTGSLIIGMVVAIFTTRFLEGSQIGPLASKVVAAPAIAIALLIIPLVDTLRVFTLRILAGKSPFKPDRLHTHHKMLELGFNHIQSTLIILLFNLLILGMALSLRYLGNIKVLFIILPMAVLGTSVPGLILRYKRMRKVEDISKKKAVTWPVPDTLMNIAREVYRREAPYPPVKGVITNLDGIESGLFGTDETLEEVDVEVYPD